MGCSGPTTRARSGGGGAGAAGPGPAASPNDCRTSGGPGFRGRRPPSPGRPGSRAEAASAAAAAGAPRPGGAGGRADVGLTDLKKKQSWIDRDNGAGGGAGAATPPRRQNPEGAARTRTKVVFPAEARRPRRVPGRERVRTTVGRAAAAGGPGPRRRHHRPAGWLLEPRERYGARTGAVAKGNTVIIP